MSGELQAFLLLAASGLFQALFAVPIKHTRGWRWEQLWTAQSVTANLLFPLAWTALAPGAFWREAANIPISHWAASYRWGLLWGLGGIAYGLAVTRLGMAFANAFIFGVTIITGALLPLALRAVEAPPRQATFVAGLLLCMLATALVGFSRRGEAQKPLLLMPFRLERFGRVIAVAAVAGVAS